MLDLKYAAVINKNITKSTDLRIESTVECWVEDGVEELNIRSWNTPHFVLGVQDTHWKWRWRGFKSGFYKVSKKVTNPDELANQVEKYVGRKYVKLHEFVTAKWAAPFRFTCTTLVWYGAKKAYDINVSSWWHTLVTPHELVYSDNTYIKCIIMK